MKITRDKMFFSKDLIHTMAYVGMFVAAIISVGACKSGIWVAAILAWIVAGIIIGLAIISDYKKAELLKNGMYGDNVFEKCGKGRDEAGDREKTRNFNGKTPLFRRERLCNYQQS